MDFLKKYYAVIDSNKKSKKIYETWEECKKNIYGVKNIKFKSFQSIKEAKKFLDELPILKNSNIDNIKTRIAIYVDGSYKEKLNNYSYGMVVVDTDKNCSIYEENGLGENNEAKELRNISGEMKGAMRAVQYSEEKNISTFSICYDYTGIEAWAKGTWKRKNKFTKTYYTYMQKFICKKKIFFIKIKGHSNNYWNNIADDLAKKAFEI